MDSAIVVEKVSKRFRRYRSDRPVTLQEAVLRGLRQLQPMEQVYALQNVSFTVAAGEMLGVIGHNGAGKSTLLRLIGGVGRPDEGRIMANGRIGALLDLGAGFHPDLTGQENVFVSGVISGLTRAEVRQRFDSIVAFAELKDFIDNPLRTYSSGMQMRLAFAIAVHIQADILLIDEALAVGDVAFQRKCLDRIARFTQDGSTGVLVSHDLTMVSQLCDQVLWLQRGQPVAYGPADTVVEQYLARTQTETSQRTPINYPAHYTRNGTKLQANQNRFGSFELEIQDVCLRNGSGHPTTAIDAGAPLHIDISYIATHPAPAPIFEVSIVREDGVLCYKTDTTSAGLTLPTLQGPGALALQIERLDLVSGLYYVDVGVYECSWAYIYDFHWHVYPLHILQRTAETDTSILCPPSHWQVREMAQSKTGSH